MVEESIGRELLDVVKSVVREKVAPRAAEIDRDHEFPRDILEIFSGLGLMGLTVADAYGGNQVPATLLVDIIIAVASACANSANLITQQALAIGPIARSGTDEQRSRWLPGLASGRLLGAYALTEPDAGSDNRSMRTTAVRHGDKYVLSGSKCFCTWGSIANYVTIFAAGQDSHEGDGFVALGVDLPASGYIVARLEEKMGSHGMPTAQLLFEDLEVPVANRIGGPGDGLRIALDALNPGRVEIGAFAIVKKTDSLAYAGRYVSERRQFGKRLAEFQGMQFKLADHATAIEAAYRLLLAAAEALDHATRDQIKLSAMAKLFATDVAMRVTTDAVGMMGGYGYLTEYPLERMMREAKLMQIVEGTNEIQRIVIAREWLKNEGHGQPPSQTVAGRPG